MQEFKGTIYNLFKAREASRESMIKQLSVIGISKGLYKKLEDLIYSKEIDGELKKDIVIKKKGKDIKLTVHSIEVIGSLEELIEDKKSISAMINTLDENFWYYRENKGLIQKSYNPTDVVTFINELLDNPDYLLFGKITKEKLNGTQPIV